MTDPVQNPSAGNKIINIIAEDDAIIAFTNSDIVEHEVTTALQGTAHGGQALSGSPFSNGKKALAAVLANNVDGANTVVVTDAEMGGNGQDGPDFLDGWFTQSPNTFPKTVIMYSGGMKDPAQKKLDDLKSKLPQGYQIVFVMKPDYNALKAAVRNRIKEIKDSWAAPSSSSSPPRPGHGTPPDALLAPQVA